MLSPDQMPSQVEQIGDRSMSSHKYLCLRHGLEAPHAPFPHPLVRHAIFWGRSISVESIGSMCRLLMAVLHSELYR
jgi:hypothetical protein